MPQIYQPLLQLYRLSAYYARNPKATVHEGKRAVGFRSDSAQHYYNCVHLRDPKGKYPYTPFKESMSQEDYNRLRTRFTVHQQLDIIKELEAGLAPPQIELKLHLHYQPVTVFSVVHRMVRPVRVPPKPKVFVPYSAKQYYAMVQEIRDYAIKYGHFPEADHLQPELILAIRETFAGGEDDVLCLSPTEPNEKPKDIADPVAKETEPDPNTTPTEPIGLLTSQLSRIESLLSHLVAEQQVQVDDDQFPSIQAFFALDSPAPSHVDRWLSKGALALFPRLIRGDYNSNSRDDDVFLFELEQAGMIEMPRIPSRDLMGSVIRLRDHLQITNKGWALHKLIQDLCEKVVQCCLVDIGSFMGFNISLDSGE